MLLNSDSMMSVPFDSGNAKDRMRAFRPNAMFSSSIFRLLAPSFSKLCCAVFFICSRFAWGESGITLTFTITTLINYL